MWSESGVKLPDNYHFIIQKRFLAVTFCGVESKQDFGRIDKVPQFLVLKCSLYFYYSDFVHTCIWRTLILSKTSLMQNRKQDRPWYFLIPKPPFVGFLLKSLQNGSSFCTRPRIIFHTNRCVLIFANTSPFKFAAVYLVSISTVRGLCSMAFLSC